MPPSGELYPPQDQPSQAAQEEASAGYQGRCRTGAQVATEEETQVSNPREQFGRRLVVKMNAGIRRELKRRFWKYVRQAFRRDIERDTERANVKQRSGWYD